jgi:hypothetical protein
LALNSSNYKKYKQIEGESDRIDFLERMLTGNILSMAKGLNWKLENKVTAKILQSERMKKVHYKGTELISFDLSFKTNVSLPPRAGLGKGTSIGFGVTRKLKATRGTIQKQEANV